MSEMQQGAWTKPAAMAIPVCAILCRDPQKMVGLRLEDAYPAAITSSNNASTAAWPLTSFT
jgi:hypothetical protein